MTKHTGQLDGLQIGNEVQHQQQVNGGWCFGDTCGTKMFYFVSH
jgi:hypothetical protein